MTDYQRLKRVIFWILSQGYAETQEEIASNIGSNVSYLSQIVNGKKKLSEKFVNSLCAKYEKVNSNWILIGKGGMILENCKDCENCKQKDKEIVKLKIMLEHYEELLGIKKPEPDKKVSSGSATDENLAS